VTASIGTAVVDCSAGAAVYEIAPTGVAHGRDLLGSLESLDNFADTYHQLLARIEADHSDCEVIDLYAAVPAPSAVQLGRGLMRDAQPALRVHDRDRDGQFRVAITLGKASRLGDRT
jgi:hypothetical protein